MFKDETNIEENNVNLSKNFMKINTDSNETNEDNSFNLIPPFIFEKQFKMLLTIISILILLLSSIYMATEDNSQFKPKIDYDNSLTSLACSIEKYFEINPLHKTMPYIDQLFEEKKPENVILILVDGLGSKIMEKVLDKNDFLMKNMKKEFYSVFPPTTASCLNTIKNGLNPSEHGWLGWSAYVPPIDKIINLYQDREKGHGEINKDFVKIKDKYYFNKKTITQLINDDGKYSAYELNCYPYNVDRDIDTFFKRILKTLNNKGKKYIFTYYPEPDDLLHGLSVKSKKTIDEIKKINAKAEEYSKLILEHEKTMLIIVADHGHSIADQKSIQDSKIINYLRDKRVFIENRSPGFLLKPRREKRFKKDFNKDFGKDFFLLSKKEVLDYNIFGEYSNETKHELFENSFGEFLAIAKDSSKVALTSKNDLRAASYHGGYSDDEIFIPLIVLSN